LYNDERVPGPERERERERENVSGRKLHNEEVHNFYYSANSVE
jgi:hypothetical protein